MEERQRDPAPETAMPEQEISVRDLRGMTTIVDNTKLRPRSTMAVRIAKAYGLKRIVHGWPGKRIERGVLYLMPTKVKIGRERIERGCGFSLRLVDEPVALEMVKVMET